MCIRDSNVKALNITREWLETHIQQVQKGLSSVDKKVIEEIAKVRAKRQASPEAQTKKRA